MKKWQPLKRRRKELQLNAVTLPFVQIVNKYIYQLIKSIKW